MKTNPNVVVEIVPLERPSFARVCQIMGEEIADQQWAKAHKKKVREESKGEVKSWD